ncbi:UNVERIFIED_CONTAM: hypothetical protein K2H54_054605 [Gekko kuhli]
MSVNQYFIKKIPPRNFLHFNITEESPYRLQMGMGHAVGHVARWHRVLVSFLTKLYNNDPVTSTNCLGILPPSDLALELPRQGTEGPEALEDAISGATIPESQKSRFLREVSCVTLKYPACLQNYIRINKCINTRHAQL